MNAALQVVQKKGLAAASARAIAAQAETNQALIFYHFGTLNELIEAASNEAVVARVARYRSDFAAVNSLPELLALGMDVHEQERRDGTIAIMAQLTAGGQYDPVLARATRYAISVWSGELQHVLDRVFTSTPIGALLDTAGLAQLISASYIGIELLHGADPEGTDHAFATIAQLNSLISMSLETREG